MSSTGEVEAQVCNSWKRLRQCYSTIPKKQKPKQMFGLPEVCVTETLPPFFFLYNYQYLNNLIC